MTLSWLQNQIRFMAKICNWRNQFQFFADSLIGEVSLPSNSAATAHIPANDRSQIVEGSVSIEATRRIEFLCQTSKTVVVELQSGNYIFKVIR